MIADTGAPPVRRGDGDGGGGVRAELRRVHGDRGYPPAESQCIPDEVDGGEGDSGGFGVVHTERCTQRGAARLDGFGGAYALHHWFGGGAASVFDDRLRFLADHRHDGGSSVWTRLTGCPMRLSRASAADRMRRGFFIRLSKIRRGEILTGVEAAAHN